MDVEREVDAVRRRAIEWAREHPADSPVPPIVRGLAPNGLVFRVIVGNAIVHEALVSDPAASPEAALAGAKATIRGLDSGEPVQLRIYDGDTGGWILTRQVLTL